jgi:hypothetical protein
MRYRANSTTLSLSSMAVTALLTLPAMAEQTKLMTVRDHTSATVSVGVEYSFFQNNELTETAIEMIMELRPPMF